MAQSLALAHDVRARILAFMSGRTADEQLLAELSRQLRRIVDFEAAFIAAADPVTGLAVSPARVENLPAELCTAYWDAEFLTQDFNHFRDLARAKQPVASLTDATDGRPSRSNRFRIVNEMLGYGDELRAVFRADGAVWGFASLWRRAGDPPFSRLEEAVLSSLGVPIAAAFRRAAMVRAFTEGGDDAQQPEGPGLLTFDEHGVLESLNDQAHAWLSELQPPPSSGRNDCQLPTELLTVTARARAIAAGIDTGVARARIQSRRGRWLVVHGFELIGSGGSGSNRPGRTALIIEPARASQVARIIVEAYQLTPREQQITRMLSFGYSTDEIAGRLSISRHTVRDYLKIIFEKVGVSSRGELVAKIFAEHYAPSLEDRIVHVMRSN